MKVYINISILLLLFTILTYGYKDFYFYRKEIAPDKFYDFFDDSGKFGKIYALGGKNIDKIEDARFFCHTLFDTSKNSTLLSINSCEEYCYIVKMLSKWLKDIEEVNLWIGGYTEISKNNFLDAYVEINGWYSKEELSYKFLNKGLCKSQFEFIRKNFPGVMLIVKKNKYFRLTIEPYEYKTKNSMVLCQLPLEQKTMSYNIEQFDVWCTENLFTLSPNSESTTLKFSGETKLTTTTSRQLKNLTGSSHLDKNLIIFLDNISQKVESAKNFEESYEASEKFFNRLKSHKFSLNTTNYIEKTVLTAFKLAKSFSNPIRTKTNVTLSKLFTKNMITIFNELLTVTNKHLWKLSNQSTSQKVLESTEMLGLSLAKDLSYEGQSKKYRVNTKHIVVEAFIFNANQSLSKAFKFPTNSDEVKSFINFPSGLDMQSLSNPNIAHITAYGSIHRDLINYLSKNNTQPNSDMIAFAFSKSISDINVKIQLGHLKKLEKGDKVFCVYWDYSKSQFSTNGCSLDILNSDRLTTTCICDHLTNFAVLMDISGRQNSDPIRSYLSVILLSVSNIFLLTNIILFFSLKSLKSRRTTITCNLCICLLAVNLLVVFGLDKTENLLLCRFITLALLYSLGSAFTWMLLEGYFLYQMIIVVFRGPSYLRTRWLYIIGYGLSTVWSLIAVLLLGFDGIVDESNYYCWISNPLRPNKIWIFLGPSLIILLLNLLVLIKSIHVAKLSKMKKNSNNIRSNPYKNDAVTKSKLSKWFKGWLSLVILLGLTWFTGLFYIHKSLEWCSYIFIISNSLQGVFIFIFEILLNGKVMREVIKLFSDKSFFKNFDSLTKTTSSNQTNSVRSRNTNLTQTKSNESFAMCIIYERKPKPSS